jgi:glutamate-1-semialdehyde aminotransferase
VEPEATKPAAFGPFRPADTSTDDQLSTAQRLAIDRIISSYVERTRASKELASRNRKHFADPRSAAGFRPLWKEMVYPIVAARSSGSKIVDVDGNEYVDVTMGFGMHLFGHLPEFVKNALREQLDRGIEIGPQSALAGEVAEMLCRITGAERATFCNTGSEAVLAGLRVARTVTGRDRIALFAGSYHGIFDEVLARRTKSGSALPVSPGIPRSAQSNVMVVEYGSPESLVALRSAARDLAAVVVEPVQSRRPDLQPREFLRELRDITAEAGTAIIFDEVVTGFRAHP